MSIPLREVMLIAAEAGLDLRTVRRILGEAHRPMLATRTVLCAALATRGHGKLARALERDGKLHESQADDSWNRGPGRPYEPQGKKGKYPKGRGKKLATQPNTR